MRVTTARGFAPTCPRTCGKAPTATLTADAAREYSLSPVPRGVANTQRFQFQASASISSMPMVAPPPRAVRGHVNRLFEGFTRTISNAASVARLTPRSEVASLLSRLALRAPPVSRSRCDSWRRKHSRCTSICAVTAPRSQSYAAPAPIVMLHAEKRDSF